MASGNAQRGEILPMLSSLRIKNLALVEDLTIDFRPGLNVLTGETGAGKSILAGAIGLILGARADALLVRKGEEQADVEARFSLAAGHAFFAVAREALLTANSEEEILLKRVVLSTGKSRGFLADQAVSLATLERLAATLVDLVGQHSHQALLKEESHLELLDAFARNGTLRAQAAEAFAAAQKLQSALDDLHRQEKEKQEKLDFYRFQIQEIAKAGLMSGEEEGLLQEEELLAHAQKWQELASGLSEELSEGEDSVTHRVGALQLKLQPAAAADSGMRDAAENIREALLLLKDSAESLRQFGEKLSADPRRLEVVQERLTRIEGLRRKYQKSVAELLQWQKDLQTKIDALENIAVEMEDANSRLSDAQEKLRKISAKLTQARQAAAKNFAAEIRGQWQELGMAGAGLCIELEPCPIGAAGAETARFLAAPNKGEGFKPLAAIASGGEMSRVMLAIRIVMAGRDTLGTLVFDEVDANIGGAVATMVGRNLRELARSHQVIVITHLPQIAYQGQTHYLVDKEVAGGRTITRIHRLNEDERVQEIARMMGGRDLTPVTVHHARELLRGAAPEALVMAASSTPTKEKGKQR